MSLSDLVAAYAAVVATLVLVWDIIKWRRAGARLSVWVSFDAFKESEGDQRRAIISVSNVGDSPATLTHIWFVWFPHSVYLWLWRLRVSCIKKQRLVYIPPHSGNELVLPKKLEHSDEWVGEIQVPERLQELRKTGRLFVVAGTTTDDRGTYQEVV